jgi:hypothetical protein
MKSKNNRSRGASSIAPSIEKLLSKQETADFLGVSVRTVEREISAGRLMKQKIRGCIRVRFSQVFSLSGLNSQPVGMSIGFNLCPAQS